MNYNWVPKKIKLTVPALRHRNYRLFWLGQCVSLVGTWMQNIGQSWLVVQLTHSPTKLGWLNAVQFLPMLLFSLWAGVIIDRFPKRRLLLYTQTSLMLLALALASLTFFKVINYWQLLVLAALLGLVHTIDMPTRQAFLFELVGKEDLMNAIALNSTIFNFARIIGPAVAGLLIGWLGMAPCFYLNALSFIPVIFGLWLIKLPAVTTGAEKISLPLIIRKTKESLDYVRFQPRLLLPLLLLGTVSLLIFNYSTFVPLIATTTLHQDAKGFGLLMAALGVGSMLGSLIIAARSQAGPKPEMILAGAILIASFLVILGFAQIYLLAWLALFVIGLAMILFLNTLNTTVQLNTTDQFRGRVMSLYTLLFAGVTPFGSLLTGYLIEGLGIGRALLLCGLGGLVTTGVVYRLYQRQFVPVNRSQSTGGKSGC